MEWSETSEIWQLDIDRITVAFVTGGCVMGVKLLDCTLRDGGYINEWNF